MSNQDLHRHSKDTLVAGQKVGGRFADQRRAEAEARALQGYTDEDIRDFSDAYSMTRKLVSNTWRAHNEVLNSREDIRQEAVIDLMTIVREKNRADREALSDGDDLTPFVERHGGLIRSVLSSKVQRVYNQGGRHESGRGRVQLAQTRREIESSIGRELTRKEFDELADAVRMEFPAGRRPSIGYQYNRPVEGTNHVIFEGEEAPTDQQEKYAGKVSYTDEYPVLGEIRDFDAAEESTVYADVLEGVTADKNDEGHIDAADAQAQIWATMQKAGTGVPSVVELTPGAAKRIRGAMGKFEDGAHGVANRFLDGRSTPAEDEALFAPFGGWQMLDEEQRDVVAEKIASGHPELGHKLWKAAVRASQN